MGIYSAEVHSGEAGMVMQGDDGARMTLESTAWGYTERNIR